MAAMLPPRNTSSVSRRTKSASDPISPPSSARRESRLRTVATDVRNSEVLRSRAATRLRRLHIWAPGGEARGMAIVEDRRPDSRHHVPFAMQSPLHVPRERYYDRGFYEL